MKELFLPYEESLELKKLGFYENCFAIWSGVDEINCSLTDNKRLFSTKFFIKDTQELRAYFNNKEYIGSLRVSAPTYSQVFKFFRDKFNLIGRVNCSFSNKRNVLYGFRIQDKKGNLICFDNDWVSSDEKLFKTWEKAELNCVRKLIELCEKLKNSYEK